jgi:hypothetical protein
VRCRAITATLVVGAILASCGSSPVAVRHQKAPSWTSNRFLRDIFHTARAEWVVAAEFAGDSSWNVPIENAWVDIAVLGKRWSLVEAAPPSWQAVSRELKTFMRLDGPQATRSQERALTSLTRALDRFFQTPGLYGRGS